MRRTKGLLIGEDLTYAKSSDIITCRANADGKSLAYGDNRLPQYVVEGLNVARLGVRKTRVDVKGEAKYRMSTRG